MNNNDVVKVIINADDLGMDARTNELVFELMAKKKITSATIMANGSACEEAVALHEKFPACSFGVHLNLTSGMPLSGNLASLAPITDSDGRFTGLDSLLYAPKTRILIKGVYNELSLQIKKLLSLGLDISHIDSHQHIHNIPSIFPAVKMLQKKYGIRRIRLSKNLYLPDDHNVMRYLKKKAFNFILKKIDNSLSTDLFTGFDTFYQIGKREMVGCNSVEVMVHLREDFQRWSDYKMLQSSWESDLVFPVKLISYNQIN
ncbi:hypothetical protein GF1_00530 [Desulfolithobacter dissulfuricans]|uniref:ChbG/HpnK family deacetylase n=1 Tax=Desulfolithobacter dissulfuricans TaxID=2795293 RepID=A0A915XIK2_9BACT|nr:ChbG/HpnK family deacetylase [Desulfolithobacter dissulfuricans]BCO07677.1 hypothetical protein GF1_00530 [Desulfolithobacter dissulfuricans]